MRVTSLFEPVLLLLQANQQTNERSLWKEVGYKQNMPPGWHLQVRLPVSESAETLPLKFTLLLHSQAAGISQSTGEKVIANCRQAEVRSLKAAYNKQVLRADGGGGGGGGVLEKEGRRVHDTGEERLNKAL